LSQLLLQDIQSKASWILTNLDDTRNYTENEFLFVYWIKWDGYTVGNKNVSDLTSHESISRCKRKLVEKNPSFRADKKIRLAKLRKEENFREWSHGN